MTDTLKRIKNSRENGGNLKGEKEHGKLTQPKKELKIKGCLLHNSDLWRTPKFLYDYFTKYNYFDPCPINPKFNGLEISWKSHNFVNPPYSQIDKWIDKALKERKKHHNSILLIPARTDTKWFRKLVENNVNIAFIQGRLHFNDKGPAPFPSMFVDIYYNIKKTTFEYLTKESIENWYIKK